MQVRHSLRHQHAVRRPLQLVVHVFGRILPVVKARLEQPDRLRTLRNGRYLEAPLTVGNHPCIVRAFNLYNHPRQRISCGRIAHRAAHIDGRARCNICLCILRTHRLLGGVLCRQICQSRQKRSGKNQSGSEESLLRESRIDLHVLIGCQRDHSPL